MLCKLRSSDYLPWWSKPNRLKKSESQHSLKISVPPGSAITEPPLSLQPAMMPVSIIPPGPPIEPLERLPRHSYSLSTVFYFYGAVLSSSLSLLATVRNLGFFFPEQARQGYLPHPTTGRMWLLRLGYFRLHEPLEPADD